MNLPTPQTILAILPTWVGDYVMATPALRAIRTRFNKAQVVHLIEPNLADLARGGNLMDAMIEWPAATDRKPWSRGFRALVARLREFRFDLAILFPNSFRSAMVAWLAGATRRVGYRRDSRSWLLTDRIPVKRRLKLAGNDGAGNVGATPVPLSVDIVPGHDWQALAGIPDRSGGAFAPVPLIEYYAQLVETAGCRRPSDSFELFTTPDGDESVEARLGSLGVAEHHPLVVVSPGARFGMAKCWPVERFAAACDRLIEDSGAAVIITCGPGEEPIARSIRASMKQDAAVFADPLLTLSGLKSLIRRADLLVCNDAGPRHIAKAFGVPVVTVFGPTHPYWTATHHDFERIVRLDVECGPCQQRICPLGHHRCMTGVTVESVVAAAQALLTDGSKHNIAIQGRVGGKASSTGEIAGR